jgi:hypothetical protein
MALRKKIYYPDSQIENGLFTKGKEWMTIDNWKEYVGYYHKYSTGEVFTEREWDLFKSKKLVSYRDRSDSYFKYLDLKKYVVINQNKTEVLGANIFSRYSAPRAVKRTPSQIEINEGFMTRYFVIKLNEPGSICYEIAESETKTFKTKNTGINQYLYDIIEIPWKINGLEFDKYENGLLKYPGIVDSNLRIIERYSKKFPILKKILTNPREHSKYNR